ncbi:hypothetical protein O7A70_10045 [Mesorhizobium sp. Cs1299R1N1]|uniref:hypothetical protein n=1 Tax=Mesorhizobium sp. Cs1299R1N1 TaxID=3015172 RepID=UPI00301CDA67
MPAYLELKPFEDTSNVGITVSRDDGRNGSFVVRKSLENSEVLGPDVRRLRETASNAAAVASAQIADRSAEGWKKEFPATIRPLATPWQQLQGAAVNRMRELDTRRADLLANRPAIPLNASEGEKLRLTFGHEVRAAQTVNWLADKKPSDLLAAALGNRELGSLILSNPSLREKLPGDLAERLETDVMEQALTGQVAANFKVKPSYEAPLGDGPDITAASAAARQAMAAFDASRNEIAGVEMVLKSAVDFVAILGDISRAEAFGMLNG